MEQAEMSVSTKPINVLELINSIPRYVGIGATLSILASVLYEYMYFKVIGSEFLSVYSPADFIKPSIYWLPGVVLVACVVIALSYGEFKERYSMYQRDAEAAEKHYKFSDRFGDITTFVLSAVYIVSIPFMTFETIYRLQYPLLVGLAFICRKWVYNNFIAKADKPVEAAFILIMGIGLFTAAGFSGFGDSISDLKKSGPIYSIKLGSEDYEVIVVRNLDKGILFRKPQAKSIYFAPWDDVKFLQSPEITISEKTLLQYIKGRFFD
jgi:hypothetical protein